MLDNDVGLRLYHSKAVCDQVKDLLWVPFGRRRFSGTKINKFHATKQRRHPRPTVALA